MVLYVNEFIKNESQNVFYCYQIARKRFIFYVINLKAFKGTFKDSHQFRTKLRVTMCHYVSLCVVKDYV